MKIYMSLLLFALAGCSSTPTPFETAEPVEPPHGCIEARKRGVDC